MPRQPDPALESRLVAAALRLLDRGGEPAITLRAVAREARTTTPTIYQRFRDRGELVSAAVDTTTDELVALLHPTEAVEGMFREFLRYTMAHPMRAHLMVDTFGRRYAAREKMPAMDLLKA